MLESVGSCRAPRGRARRRRARDRAHVEDEGHTPVAEDGRARHAGDGVQVSLERFHHQLLLADGQLPDKLVRVNRSTDLRKPFPREFVRAAPRDKGRVGGQLSSARRTTVADSPHVAGGGRPSDLSPNAAVAASGASSMGPMMT